MPLSISISGPAAAEAGAEAEFSATLSGTGAKAENVRWSSEGGTFSASTGLQTIWTAPPEAGSYRITATVEADGESASDEASIEVRTEEPEDPLSIRIEGIDEALLGVEYELTALASGTGSDEALISWTATAGVLDTTEGRSVRWTAPASSTNVSITATVIETDISDTIDLRAVLCRVGAGTSEETPCPIANVIQLQALEEDLTLHYALANDIDATVTSTWGRGNQGFAPLRSGAFTGSLSGNGFTIDGLHINRPDTDHVALFAVIERTGVIKDLQLTNVDFTGKSMVAGLAAENSGTIRNSHVSGAVTATGILLESGSSAYAGGLVARNYRLIEHSSSSVTVTSNGGFAGGMVGFNGSQVVSSSASGAAVQDTRAYATTTELAGVGGLAGGNGGTISDSFSAVGQVTSEGRAVGGLVGTNSRGVIQRSFTDEATTVIGGADVGGLVGENSAGLVVQSYSRAQLVEGTSDVGGLIGKHHETSSKVEESYSTSDVRGGANTGGLIGATDTAASTTRSLWDMQTSGQPTSAGGVGAIGVTTSVMRNSSTYTALDWNLTEVWLMARTPTEPPRLRTDRRR